MPPTPTAGRRPSPQTDDDAVEFIVEMARALCQHGTPAHRLETAMSTCAQRLGLHAEFFATPTAVFASIGEARDNVTRLVRVESADLNLDRLAQIDFILQCVSSGELAPSDGRRELRETLKSPPAWPVWAATLAFALAAATASRFFGGGWREITAAAMAGLIVGLAVLLSRHTRRLIRVFEFAAGMLVAAFATAAASSPLGVDHETVIISGLIVLLPGLSLTIAVSEIAARNIVAGSARLIGAATSGAVIAFGVAVGTGLVGAMLTPHPVPIIPFHPSTLWLALALAPLALVILFSASPRDLPAVALVTSAGFLTARLTSDTAGTTLGIAAGALVVGLISNARAIRVNRPVAVCSIPGIMLLVPGSIGFRSLAAFLEQQAVRGLEAAVLAASVALGLAIGLLLANVILPPKREL